MNTIVWVKHLSVIKGTVLMHYTKEFPVDQVPLNFLVRIEFRFGITFPFYFTIYGVKKGVQYDL